MIDTKFKQYLFGGLFGLSLALLVLDGFYAEAQTSPTGGGSPTTPAAFCKISTGWALCDTSARLGIGTSAPTTTLGVLGTSRFNGAVTVTGALTINSITGSTQCLQADTNGLVSGTACGTGAPGQNGAWQSVFADTA